MDGIDVSAVTTDGSVIYDVFEGRLYPYPKELQSALRETIANPHIASKGRLTELEAYVTQSHTDAVQSYLSEMRFDAPVDVVGFHGQTVFHSPQQKVTRQLFDPALAVAQLHLPLVCDFRSADVKAGGEGAPLAPLYHRAILDPKYFPAAILNLGGVANITYLDREATIAFDTGPASAILDDLLIKRAGISFDRDGVIARSGDVIQSALDRLLADPYFQVPAPKSLDRNAFHETAMALLKSQTLENASATLVEFTCASVKGALSLLPKRPKTFFVCGGGRLNGFMMERLSQLIGLPVYAVETIGFDGDFIESQCFAFLAVRSVLGLPLSLPTTTGVKVPMAGGQLTLPETAS